MKRLLLPLLLLLLPLLNGKAKEPHFTLPYNIQWNSPSSNSSESMPCGGGDVGLNVWVEGDDLLFYIARSGTFDENNEMLKLGRIRINLPDFTFKNSDFSQVLNLAEGAIKVSAQNNGVKVNIDVWVDVFNPSVYVDITTSKALNARVSYENWRFEDFELRKFESFGNSYKWAPPKGLTKKKDTIWVSADKVYFLHQNKGETVFDITVKQQGLESEKNKLTNPLDSLVFGGILWGENFVFKTTLSGEYQQTDYNGWQLESKSASKKHQIALHLNTMRTSNLNSWASATHSGLQKAIKNKKASKKNSINWWSNFWQRSFILVDADQKDSTSWQVGRNYNLFRYMLACNAYGSYPTKFNGGLFTYDPCFVNDTRCFSPDFRNWGGGTFTAQNQRLVYFPMLKSGDFDFMKSQFDFYKNLLNNAITRSNFYWGHNGACFTEQLENFGLPNPSEYGWKRPEWYDRGMQYNAWLEYQWDTALEICLMILEQHRYNGTDISEYLDLIYSCLVFFDEHYQYLAKQRGRKALDADDKLVLYPGSSCETYKMAYNATSTVAGLQVVTSKLLEEQKSNLSEEQVEYLTGLMKRIPDISYRKIDGHKTIAPAKLWERINNTESPQLYPVYPYKIYGLGKPGFDVAKNTFLYDPDIIRFGGYESWKQTNIFAARLGIADTAWKYTALKLVDSDRRFPAFWGPGFDWVPDHNWGGSGMIGLQEMLLQESDNKILLFPAWPADKDVHFKLHCSANTIIEASMKDGKPEIISVFPETRRKDVVISTPSN